MMEDLVFNIFDMMFGWMRSQALIGVLVGILMVLAGLGVFLASLFFLFRAERVELRLVRFEDCDVFKKKDLEEGEEHKPSWFPVYAITSGALSGIKAMGNVGCKHDPSRIGEVSLGFYLEHGHGPDKPSLTSLNDVKSGLWVPLVFVLIGAFVIAWFGGFHMQIPTMSEIM